MGVLEEAAAPAGEDVGEGAERELIVGTPGLARVVTEGEADGVLVEVLGPTVGVTDGGLGVGTTDEVGVVVVEGGAVGPGVP